MKKIFNWLFTNYKGDKVTLAWFVFNIGFIVFGILLLIGVIGGII